MFGLAEGTGGNDGVTLDPGDVVAGVPGVVLEAAVEAGVTKCGARVPALPEVGAMAGAGGGGAGAGEGAMEAAAIAILKKQESSS